MPLPEQVNKLNNLYWKVSGNLQNLHLSAQTVQKIGFWRLCLLRTSVFQFRCLKFKSLPPNLVSRVM